MYLGNVIAMYFVSTIAIYLGDVILHHHPHHHPNAMVVKETNHSVSKTLFFGADEVQVIEMTLFTGMKKKPWEFSVFVW